MTEPLIVATRRRRGHRDPEPPGEAQRDEPRDARRALRRAFDALDEDAAVRVVVVRGAGPAFCSGMDLREMDAAPAEGADPESGVTEVLRRIERSRHPTIAMVNGDALAGGCELALHCDLRVAADAARFGMPLARIGLIVPFPLGMKLVEIAGPAFTRELLFTGRPVSAARAREMGMVHQVVPAGGARGGDLCAGAGHRPERAAVARGDEGGDPAGGGPPRDHRPPGSRRGRAPSPAERRRPRGTSGDAREAAAAVPGCDEPGRLRSLAHFSSHAREEEAVMLNEFIQFLQKTNALALAIAVIIGGAIGKVVASVVADLLMPVIGLWLGGGDWRAWQIPLKTAPDGKVLSAINLGQLLRLRDRLRHHRALRVPDHQGAPARAGAGARPRHEDVPRVRREHPRPGHALQVLHEPGVTRRPWDR